ncbi:hypothetical protein JCM6882_006282 [Rhodosporidiobolus microsporus]
MSWLSRSGSRMASNGAHHPGGGGVGASQAPPPPPASLFVVRSSDGAEFGLTKEDFRNISTLDELRFNLLSPLLSIPPDCLILMNESGSPLNRDEAVQHLAMMAGTPSNSMVLRGEGDKAGNGERRIYVFDREHLDAEPEEVARALAVTEEMVLSEPPLNIEDPLPSHLFLSHHNLSTLRALISSIHLQHSSLALALSNLHRVNTGTSSSFSLFLESARPNMERYERLLGGWEEAMDAVGKVGVVAGLLMRGGGGAAGHGREGSTASMVSGAGVGEKEKQRFLGDYVSRDKMLAVRDGCAKVLADLKLRTDSLQATLDEVVASTDAVQADLEATSHDLEDLQACEQDADQGHLRIEELVHAGEQMSDPELQAQCFEELSVCDAEHRDRIRFLVERKNAMTRYLLQEMQKISTLQSDIATMPAELGQLDHDLRTRTDNFKHLARLEGLIPAYVATVAEVVRRREYSRLLETQSTSLSISFDPLSNAERSRRATYRASFSGKLPWEVRGLAQPAGDDSIPEIPLGVDQKGQEALPELGSETLGELQSTFETLDEELGGAVGEENPIRKARGLLKELVGEVEELRRDFEQVSLNPPPPRPPSVAPARLAELEAQIRQLEDANESLTRELQTERSAREEEVAQLEARCSASEGAGHLLRSRIDALERDKVDLDKARKDASSRAESAQRDFVAENERREAAERDLHVAKAAEAELRKQWTALDQSLTRVQAELGTAKIELEQAKTLGGERGAELDSARAAQRELVQTVAEKDKLLRDQRNEAQCDRAVLESKTDELVKALAAKEGEADLAAARIVTLEEISEGLREQIARWETVALAKEEDVGAAKKEVEDAKREKEKSVVDVQRELVRMTAVAREAMTLAGRLRDENNNITAILNAPPPSSSSTSKGDASAAELDKAASPDPSTPAPAAFSSPIPSAAAPAIPPLDYANGDLDDLLRELSKYNHDALTDAVKNKVDSLTNVTKKWVKEAKAYRERAHRATSATNDKIAFRNFAKGDLALFLPTRNSAVPVWAAFNVSFPHHFLSATGVIAEQMKTREWIVARITSLTEKVVDPRDPSTNPYLLAGGTKYFTLEVEPWSSKESSRSRRHSTADKLKSSEKKSSKEARAGRVSESAITTRSASGADSAILVDRPSVSASTPNIRRTVSEGGPLPPNATSLARSEYALVEVEEEPQAESRTPSPPTTFQQQVPRPDDRYESPTATPSALSRALARSTPSSPTDRRSDPFAPSSSTNPFTSSSSPVVDSPLRRSPTPPTTDYDPACSSVGAAPAFLPSSGKKPHSTAGSTAGSSTSQSPRYVRSSARPIGTSSSSRSGGGGAHHPSPADALLSASPASTTASSVNVVSHPRSVSSGSSILSSSIHRRASNSAFGLAGVSPPPLPGGKAPSTAEAQLTGSRWNLLQEDLGQEGGAGGNGASRPPSSSAASMTIGRKASRGWPSGVASSGASSRSPTPADQQPPSRSGQPSSSSSALSTSASSMSILDLFGGKRTASGAAGGGGGGSRRKESVSGAEGDLRKLLGQPPF